MNPLTCHVSTLPAPAVVTCDHVVVTVVELGPGLHEVTCQRCSLTYKRWGEAAELKGGKR